MEKREEKEKERERERLYLVFKTQHQQVFEQKGERKREKEVERGG